MRICLVIEATGNSSVAGSRTWYRNFYEPLVEMGHEVVLVPAEEGRRAMWRRDDAARTRFSEKLAETFMREHARRPFHLFFAYLTDGMVDSAVIDLIRKTGVPTCNFSCNNAHQFFLVDELSPHFDYNLHSERDARGKFLVIGANPVWWPMASNPRYYKPYAVPRSVAVSFVGGNYALRGKYLGHLLEHGVDVHVYGPAWRWGARTAARARVLRSLLMLKAVFARSPEARARDTCLLADHDLTRSLVASYPSHFHDPVSDEELVRLYSESHVSLGFLEVYDRHDPSRIVLRHLHLREFEAPMCGALYCTGHSDELAEFFVPGSEVITYRDAEELLDKVKYFLAHPGEAERVRLAGYRRAVSEHTYHQRFQQLFERLGLPK